MSSADSDAPYFGREMVALTKPELRGRKIPPIDSVYPDDGIVDIDTWLVAVNVGTPTY